MHTAFSCRVPTPSPVVETRANPVGAALASPGEGPRPRLVREHAADRAGYEAEGSERRALGSIAAAGDPRWLATLTVPIPGDRVAFVQVERRGELPDGYRGAEERVLLSVPEGELEAVVALLAGVVAQARRDGVLPASTG